MEDAELLTEDLMSLYRMFQFANDKLITLEEKLKAETLYKRRKGLVEQIANASAQVNKISRTIIEKLKVTKIIKIEEEI